MKPQCACVMLSVLLCAPNALAGNGTVWKVHGKSAYADTPPDLRLHNVQVFYPRTGKLSELIRAKPRKPVKKHAETATADAFAPHPSAPPDHAETISAAETEQEPVSPAEQQRRDMCQAAQDALQRAAAQNADVAAHEADVVRHCIAA